MRVLLLHAAPWDQVATTGWQGLVTSWEPPNSTSVWPAREVTHNLMGFFWCLFDKTPPYSLHGFLGCAQDSSSVELRMLSYPAEYFCMSSPLTRCRGTCSTDHSRDHPHPISRNGEKHVEEEEEDMLGKRSRAKPVGGERLRTSQRSTSGCGSRCTNRFVQRDPPQWGAESTPRADQF